VHLEIDEPSSHSPNDLLDLAGRMSDLGQLDEALAMAQDAVAIYRRLAQLHPDFLPDLVRALTDVGVIVSQLSWQLAVAPAQEAATIYRRLTVLDLGAAPDAARPLSDLLSFLTEMSTCPSLV
jgi:hypothetical protein